MSAWASFVLTGAVVGFFVGATGIGGGALMTPLLVSFLGVPPATSVGTDLVFAAITKGVGVAAHGRSGGVDWRLVKRLAAGSLPAAALTTGALAALGHERVRRGLILHALGVALLLTAVGLLLSDRIRERVARRHEPRERREGVDESLRALLPTVGAGALIGVLVSLTSVGAGALGTVVLVALRPARSKLSTLVGTDLAHAIPLAIVAGAGHLALGNVDFRLLAWLLLGSIPGILLGVALATRLPEAILTRSIGVVLAVVGVRLLG